MDSGPVLINWLLQNQLWTVTIWLPMVSRDISSEQGSLSNLEVPSSDWLYLTWFGRKGVSHIEPHCKTSSVEKRPASYRDPKARNPKLLEKNSKMTPWAPTPNSLKKTQKILKILKKNYFSGIFSIFWVFFKEFRVGAQGVIFEFFSRNFGFRAFGSL